MVIWDAVAMTGTLESQPFRVLGNKDDRCGVQLIWTGTPVGTFSVLASNDYDTATDTGNWIAVSMPDMTSIQPAGTAATHGIDLSRLPYAWARIHYVHSSGSGDLSGVASVRDF